jgi:hypothetical protein
MADSQIQTGAEDLMNEYGGDGLRIFTVVYIS